jgi:hypothetical protein
MSNKYILIYGNPVDGMKFEGPFEEFEDAEDHTLFHDNDWWIAELKDPEEVTPTCDICGKPDYAGVPDWNGETGNHVSCESDTEIARAMSGAGRLTPNAILDDNNNLIGWRDEQPNVK